VDGNGYSDFPEISADGQTVAFRSSSSNLAAHTPELGPNVFVRDLATRRTSRLHVSGGTWPAAISDHGRFVLFFNYYEVPNGIQLYLRGRRRQTTQRVSFGLLYAWTYGDSLSANGRYAAFLAHTDGEASVFVYDRVEKRTVQVDVDTTGGDTTQSAISEPSISADGRFVAFSSDAADLVPNDTNGDEDAFLRGPLH